MAMTELLTAAQMRAIEAAAIASGEVTGLELMERAGQGVVEAIFAKWPELAAGSFRAVVLCGPGGNGGDGFVVARLLKEWGWETTVHLRDAGKEARSDAATTRAAYEAIGGITMPMPDPLDRAQARSILGLTDANLDGPILLVDAMFGTGLTRSIDRADGSLCALLYDMGDLIARIGIKLRIVAVDIPSGLCADSGRVLTVEGRDDEDPVIHADLTVTFHGMKVGHMLAEGPYRSGSLLVVDLGLDPHGSDGACRLVGRPAAWRLAKHNGHKFAHGHAFILSGPAGDGGAARLAARGALRIGAGLVTLGCPEAALAENAARLDAVMLKVVDGAEDLAAVLGDARINALCLGPGLGVERAEEMLGVALRVVREDHAPCTVLDADALTALSRDPALFALLHKNCVLTPHGGEFARLFPDIAAKLKAPATRGPAYSKVDAAREAAKRAGCVVLFKGADTVIAGPDGRCAINSAAYERAAPWLATAGSGDVLAGFITGLLARGFAPFEAACTGAWLHVECARSFGPGLIAEDLAEELPKVFRALGV